MGRCVICIKCVRLTKMVNTSECNLHVSTQEFNSELSDHRCIPGRWQTYIQSNTRPLYADRTSCMPFVGWFPPEENAAFAHKSAWKETMQTTSKILVPISALCNHRNDPLTRFSRMVLPPVFLASPRYVAFLRLRISVATSLPLYYRWSLGSVSYQEQTIRCYRYRHRLR
jgi:hypothetical protein